MTFGGLRFEKENSMKKLLTVCVAAVLLLSLTACGKTDTDTITGSMAYKPAAETAGVGTHHAEIDIQDYGTITVELDGDAAPITVQNFMDLANDGFYDGLTFHRIIAGFMMQGGDPNGNGTGGSENTIKGEFSSNGVENTLSHTRGAISMARSQNPDSASSQFFICHADSTFLDGQYACFGYVTDGMDVVDEIVSQPRNMITNKPKKPQVMKSVTVDTQGVEYPEPEKLPDPFHS